MESNFSLKKANLEINCTSPPPIQGQSTNASKNALAFENTVSNNKINVIEKGNLNEDNLDHPKPLESDFDGREDIRQSLILEDIRKNNKLNKENKANRVKNLQNDYSKIVNNKENSKLTPNKNKNEKKIIRVNLNEINKIIFKNKFKRKQKETNKNNNTEVKEEQKSKIKVQNVYKQNPFIDKDIQIKYFNKVKIPPKQTITKERDKKQISIGLNKEIKSKVIEDKNKYYNNKTNNHTQINVKDALYFEKHKPKLTLGEKDIWISGTLNSSYTSLKTNNSTSRTKISPGSNKQNYNQIYISPNPNQKYFLNQKYRKNANLTNIPTSETESPKEKNINIKKRLINIKNYDERTIKDTFNIGGEYNNLQTTYIISTKNIKPKKTIKVNKNIILNNSNICKLGNINLNDFDSNVYCSLNSSITKSQNKKNEVNKSTHENNIHICPTDVKKNKFNRFNSNYILNTDRNKYFLQKNKYNNFFNICDYNTPKNNTKNNKYINIRTNIGQMSLNYSNGNNYINNDIYNKTPNYQKNTRIPFWNNDIGSKVYTLSNNYNY